MNQSVCDNLISPFQISVYAEYAFIGPNLTHERFEMVETPNEADVVWYTWHFKEFKEFADESPHKRINQFPFEHVLTIKVTFFSLFSSSKIIFP